MEEKKVSSDKNSTVAISPADAKRLDRFCKANGLSKKEFISASLTYFSREGINPKIHESGSAELTKITKRIDQIFAFIKKQEQDILKPMILESVKGYKEQENSFRNVFENQAKLQRTISGEAKGITQEVSLTRNKLVEIIEQRQNGVNYSQEEIRKAILILAEYMDEKNKKGLLGKLFN